MNPSSVIPEHSARPSLTPENCELSVLQQPERAKVVAKGKEKDRKPIDPPPVVQLIVRDTYNSICSFVHSPYLFCSCTLWEDARDEPKLRGGADKASPMIGSVTSSLHRLKDLQNIEGGFFVFGDVSANVSGKARMHFQLYELRPSHGEATPLKSVTSKAFEVVATAKDWDGVKESTMLSRSFADQGVRLRLRKESRNSARAYGTMSGNAPSSSVNATPIRPHPPSTGSQTYASASSPESEHPSKKHKPFNESMEPSSTYPGAPNLTQTYAPSSTYGQAAAQGSHPSPYASNTQQPVSYAQNYSGYSASAGQYQSFPQQGAYTGYNVQPVAQQQQPQYQAGLSQQYQYPQQQYATQYATTQFQTQGQYPSQYQRSPTGFYGQQRPTGAIANPSSTPTLPPMRSEWQGQTARLVPSIEDAQTQQGQPERDDR